MKKMVIAALVLMAVVSFSHAQNEGAAAKSKDSFAEKVSATIDSMESLVKESTPKKMQDAADVMEKLTEDIKDMLKKMEKGSAKEKEMKAMFEDLKDMLKKLKNGSAATKDMEDIKDKIKKLQKPDQK